jgi:hypothetical protein
MDIHTFSPELRDQRAWLQQAQTHQTMVSQVQRLAAGVSLPVAQFFALAERLQLNHPTLARLLCILKIIPVAQGSSGSQVRFNLPKDQMDYLKQLLTEQTKEAQFIEDTQKQLTLAIELFRVSEKPGTPFEGQLLTAQRQAISKGLNRLVDRIEAFLKTSHNGRMKVDSTVTLKTQHVSVPVKINQKGEVSVKLKFVDLVPLSDKVLALSPAQLIALSGTWEGQVMRALLIQELHDRQQQRGPLLGSTPAEAKRVRELHRGLKNLVVWPSGKPAVAEKVGLLSRVSSESRLVATEGVPFWTPGKPSQWRPGNKVKWTVNGAPNQTLFFFPDLHGGVHLLNKMLETVLPMMTKERSEKKNEKWEWVFTFAGDYGNKGHFSAEVVDRILELRRLYPFITWVFLRGNHEGSYTKSIYARAEKQDVNDAYMKNVHNMLSVCGFDLTFESYMRRAKQAVPSNLANYYDPPNVAEMQRSDPGGYKESAEYKEAIVWYKLFQKYFLSLVPPEHTRFYQRELRLFYQPEGSDYYYSHSSGDPTEARRTSESLMWARPLEIDPSKFANSVHNNKFLMFGHNMVNPLVASPYGLLFWDTSSFVLGQYSVGVVRPKTLDIITLQYGTGLPPTVMSVEEAIEQRHISTEMDRRNAIPNVRRVR